MTETDDRTKRREKSLPPSYISSFLWWLWTSCTDFSGKSSLSCALSYLLQQSFFIDQNDILVFPNSWQALRIMLLLQMTVNQTNFLYTSLIYYCRPCLKCPVLNKILPCRLVSHCKESIRMTSQMLLQPLYLYHRGWINLLNGCIINTDLMMNILNNLVW